MKVLLVEDERRFAAVVKEGLVAEGFVVDIVPDGITGLWAASENSYDVIVLDIMLPGQNGYDVLKHLRERKVWTPVLMLTAKDGEYDQTDAFDLGADDYLTKPFTFAELTARLRALIRRGAPARPLIIEVGDLGLDPATRRAWRASVELDLTAKEFALLELFMRHPGEVLSRTRILEHVWDFAFDGVSNVVDQYVGYLRRKIDRPFGCSSLHTVRGAGYRLHASSVTPSSVA